MSLYSSSFISIVLAFLMFFGYSSQAVDVIEEPTLPDFRNMIEKETEISADTVEIEVFDDLTCKYCTDFITNTLPKIKDIEQETDDVSLHIYFIPDINDEMYYMAALSLKCAADQNKFWEMHRKLHENKADLSKKSFYQFAKELELNADLLQQCVDEETHKSSVESDMKYASESNISVKPATVIGKYQLLGNQPFENIQMTINKVLKEMQTESKTPLTDTVSAQNPVATGSY